jgi:Flp pilus assembly protein TadG
MKTFTLKSQSQDGQAILEVALLTPFLLALLVGVVEIGRYAYIGILIGNAARAGAAYGAQTTLTAGNQSEITAAANKDYQSNGNVGTLAVSSAYVCTCDSGGSGGQLGGCPTACASGHQVVSLQVTATGTFNPLFHGAFGIPQVTTMSRTATMRIGECPTCAE